MMALLVALAACGGGSKTLTGTLTMDYADTDNCRSGVLGYDDIRVLANVVVRDGEGNVVGMGRITGSKHHHGIMAGSSDDDTCVFEFFADVTRKADFYTVEIAGRGGPIYSHDELEDSGWLLQLSLG